MKQYLTAFPPELMHTLNRWYIISAVCIIITLCSTTALHIYTLWYVPSSVHRKQGYITTQSNDHAIQELDQIETARINEKIQALSTAGKQHMQLTPLIHASMSTLAPHIHITTTHIQHYNHFHCVGTAQHMCDIIAFMQTLFQAGFTSTRLCTINKTTDTLAPLTFTIAVEKTDQSPHQSTAIPTQSTDHFLENDTGHA